MMIDLVLGKTEDEAKKLCGTFMKMITGEVSQEELESLDEAAALQDIARMPARVKCAELGWKTMKTILEKSGADRDATSSGTNNSHC